MYIRIRHEVRKLLRKGYAEGVSHGFTRNLMRLFPALAPYVQTGPRENLFIRAGYTPRLANSFFDDTGNADNWQREVYQFARSVCDREDLRVVCDIGCGSGYKLVTNFEGFATIGVDLPRTCAYLRERYPGREWAESDFTKSLPQAIDMVIAADVIEHLPNPDEMLSYISELHPRRIVLSTPDRHLVGRRAESGPPPNPAHVREWSFSEFCAYIGSVFEVDEHFISNEEQATQCILCRPRVKVQ